MTSGTGQSYSTAEQWLQLEGDTHIHLHSNLSNRDPYTTSDTGDSRDFCVSEECLCDSFGQDSTPEKVAANESD